jgi:16S rRNA (guanine527-N7)-methyltransferase
MDDEAEAKAWLDVPREKLEKLERYAALLREENQRQNLVSEASLEHVWSRHIADSAQLDRLAPAEVKTWLDLGSGAGLPGIVLALLQDRTVTLVESRRLRVDFLRRVSTELGIEQKVEILPTKIEAVDTRPFDAITARAFAPLPRLLSLAARFSTPGSVWILPKGRNAKSELEAVRASWQGDFRVAPSVTDPEAGIIVARGVRARERGKGGR